MIISKTFKIQIIMKINILIFAILLLIVCNSYADDDKNTVLEKVRNSIVNIETFGLPEFGKFQAINKGTGFIIREDGLVLTNYDNVKDVRGILIYTRNAGESKPYFGVPIIKDTALNLAIIKVFDLQEKALEFADTNIVSMGAEVLVPGYLGQNTDRNKINSSWGIISSDTQDTLSQTSAPLNDGNAGSPVVNMHGKVVGIAVGKITGYSVENMGLFLNSKYILEFIGRVKSPVNIDSINVLPMVAGSDLEIKNLRLKELAGTSKVQAYKNFCLAEYYKQNTGKRDSLQKNFEVLDSCKKLIGKATEVDDKFYLAYFYLAIYNIEQQMLCCALDIDASDYKLYEEFKSAKYSLNTIAYDLKTKNPTAELLYAFMDGASLDCDSWNYFYKFYKEKYSLRDERADEIYNYFHYGKYPGLLKEAMDEQDSYYDINKTKYGRKTIKFGISIGFVNNENSTKNIYFCEYNINPNYSISLNLIEEENPRKKVSGFFDKFIYQIGVGYKDFSLKWTPDDKQTQGVYRYYLEYLVFADTKAYAMDFYLKFGAGIINLDYYNDDRYFLDRDWSIRVGACFGISNFFFLYSDYDIIISDDKYKLLNNLFISFGMYIYI